MYVRIVSIRSMQNESSLEKIKEECNAQTTTTATNYANPNPNVSDTFAFVNPTPNTSTNSTSDSSQQMAVTCTDPNDIQNKSMLPPPEGVLSYRVAKLVQDNRQVSKERLKRFIKIKKDNIKLLNVPQKKLACEKDVNEFNKLKDTIRCSCGTLYQRANKTQHIRICNKVKLCHKYGCAFCPFKHDELEEVQEHILFTHKPQK